eukprot:jgi/Mesvir1/23614/Mv18296-RA.1
MEDVLIPGDGAKKSFRVYKAGFQGEGNKPVVLFLHGGGYTGLTWACVAKVMKAENRILAPDLRGHGETHTDEDLNLASEVLVDDVVTLIAAMFEGDVKKAPPLVVVGHSMGGALAARVVASRRLPTAAALVVIDVVEGTAMASLSHMTTVLNARPSSFPSAAKAVEWTVKHHHAKNVEAARVSMPSQLIQREGETKLVWRTPLEKSEQYWRGWFEGLSDIFLDGPVPKMLMLAGTDRLDKTLIIGQMQGKFQQTVLPKCGHAVQEDEPVKTAEAIQTLITRFRIGKPIPVLPRKSFEKAAT